MGWVKKIYKKSERFVTRSNYTRRYILLTRIISKVTKKLRPATLSHQIWNRGQRKWSGSEVKVKDQVTEGVVWQDGRVAARRDLGLTSMHQLPASLRKMPKRERSRSKVKLHEKLWQDCISVPLLCSMAANEGLRLQGTGTKERSRSEGEVTQGVEARGDLGPTSMQQRPAASSNKVKKERSKSKLKLPKGLWQDWTSV